MNSSKPNLTIQKGEDDFRENKIPESLGLGVAMIYCCAIILLYGVASLFGFRHFSLILKSNLIFVGFNTFLGYVDDMIGNLDILQNLTLTKYQTENLIEFEFQLNNFPIHSMSITYTT